MEVKNWFLFALILLGQSIAKKSLGQSIAKKSETNVGLDCTIHGLQEIVNSFKPEEASARANGPSAGIEENNGVNFHANVGSASAEFDILHAKAVAPEANLELSHEGVSTKASIGTAKASIGPVGVEGKLPTVGANIGVNGVKLEATLIEGKAELGPVSLTAGISANTEIGRDGVVVGGFGVSKDEKGVTFHTPLLSVKIPDPFSGDQDCSYKYGCHKGYCWSGCAGAFRTVDGPEWCYTKKPGSNDYATCDTKSDCSGCWHCKGACAAF
jgi:hypothetical protein